LSPWEQTTLPKASLGRPTYDKRVIPLEDGPCCGGKADPICQVEVGEQAAVVDELQQAATSAA
jgi:hypothetical protein